METVQVIGLGLVATFFLVILRTQRPEMALQLALVAGAVLFFLVLGKLSAVVYTMQQLASRAQVNPAYMGTVFRIVGIAYLTGFAAQISRDAGEGAIASRIEIAAKIIIMFLAIPIMWAVLETVLRLL